MRNDSQARVGNAGGVRGGFQVETLEGRRLLAGNPLAFEMYFPEGFASDAIFEQISISNANAGSADWSLEARYETGTRDQVIASGQLAADTRTDVTISDPASPQSRVVRAGEPFALVLRSTQALSASFTHGDFGDVLGAPFTSETSDTWSFADVRVGAGANLAFVLYYNPGTGPVDVTLTLYSSSGVVTSVTQTLEGQRRGGWALADIPGLADGHYSALVTSSAPIVASTSGYGVGATRGMATLGDAHGGSTTGFIPTINLAERFDDADAGGVPIAPSHDATVSILNSGPSDASVTLTFVTNSPAIAPVTQGVVVPAGRRLEVDASAISLSPIFDYALAFSSDMPVTLSVSANGASGGAGAQASSAAASIWTFAGGEMLTGRAGNGILENVHVYNPASVALDVFIDLTFDTGEVLSLTMSVESHRTLRAAMHDVSELLARSGRQAYSIRVSAAQEFAAYHERWDDVLGGGYLAAGNAEGSVGTLILSELP